MFLLSCLSWAMFVLTGMTEIFSAQADDRFSCCMAGWKEIRGVIMCPGPCCHGYEERVMDLPLLQRPIVCHKLNEEEMAERRRVQTLMKENFLPNKTKSMNSPPPIASGKWNGRQVAGDVASRDILVPPVTKIGSKSDAPKEVSEDEPNDPQKSEKAAFEFEDFLQRNKHLFVHLLSEGLSRKELISGFEEFLAS